MGTWRDNNNSVNKIAPQKRLALSYAYVAATDRRGALPNHTEDGRLRREGFLGSTEERLKVEVEVAESMEQKRKARFQAQVVAADRKHWEYHVRTTKKLDAEVTQSQAYIVAAEREYWEEIRAQAAAELDANAQEPESSYPSDFLASL
jgi:hypothetical protein